MYVEIPAVEGTALSRIAALQASRDLLMEEPSTSKTSIFGGESHNPGSVAGPTALIRLASYIETGHDYRDTHPEGKRRPIIKQTTNVTVMAPPGIPEDEIEHFLHHVENGDFADFLKDAMNQHPDEAKTEDEPEHQPQAEGDRPRFA